MSDYSEPVKPEDIPNLEKLFENLAVTMHVGFTRLDETVIGWANAFRNKDDGTTTIVMTLDPEASDKLKNLNDVFELYSLGFAGKKKGVV